MTPKERSEDLLKSGPGKIQPPIPDETPPQTLAQPTSEEPDFKKWFASLKLGQGDTSAFGT